MKKMMILNTWILLGSWSLFLNDFAFLAIGLTLVGSIMNLVLLKCSLKDLMIPFLLNMIMFQISSYTFIWDFALSFYLATFIAMIRQDKKPSPYFYEMVLVIAFSFYLCALIFGFILKDYLIYWLLTVHNIFFLLSFYSFKKIIQRSIYSCPSHRSLTI